MRTLSLIKILLVLIKKFTYLKYNLFILDMTYLGNHFIDLFQNLHQFWLGNFDHLVIFVPILKCKEMCHKQSHFNNICSVQYLLDAFSEPYQISVIEH